MPHHIIISESEPSNHSNWSTVATTRGRHTSDSQRTALLPQLQHCGVRLRHEELRYSEGRSSRGQLVPLSL